MIFRADIKKIILEYFIISAFISFLFLWGVKFNQFQLRYFVIILLIPSFIFFKNDLKNKNYTFLKFFLIFALILLLHFFFITYLSDDKFDVISIVHLLFLIFIFIIAFFHFEFFNDKILKIISAFIIIFFISTLISFFNYEKDAPFFCGGLPDLWNFSNYNFLGDPSKKYYDLKLSYKEFLFSENSHLGMLAPGLITFLIYYLINNKLEFLHSLLIYFFFLAAFIKSSTTLLAGMLASLLIFIIFNHKDFNTKIKFVFCFLIIYLVSILFTDNQCKNRLGLNSSLILNIKNNLSLKKSFEQNTNMKEFSENVSQDFLNYSLTNSVTKYAFSITKRSIIDKPFGWGFNRYEKAFEHYKSKFPPITDEIGQFNKQDGTNNFVKIFVEFGFFGLLFYFFIFLFLINKKISIDLKLFYLPFIFTQSIRGAGYFNGGFALIFFLMLFTYLNTYKKFR